MNKSPVYLHDLKTACVFECVRASDARCVSGDEEPPWSSSSAGIHSRLDRPLNWLLHFSIITIIRGYYERRLLLLGRRRTFPDTLHWLGSPHQTNKDGVFLAFNQIATAPHGGREGGACLFYLVFCLWRLNVN